MTIHLNDAQNVRVFVCEACDKMYYTISGVRKHINRAADNDSGNHWHAGIYDEEYTKQEIKNLINQGLLAPKRK